ncbi:MAG: TolC family protein [Phycisphaerae bacterium]|nr:TolC family protein [Phycisphaerae bacterium]
MAWTNRWLPLVMLAAGLHGCVSPGSVDVDDVYRLQQAVRHRNPQNRGDEGLAPMRPASGRLPALPVKTSEDGKTRLVEISLQDVVMRALANNTDIAVVAYTPAIRREQMVQAAAAFDYVVFGSIGYEQTDNPVNDKLRKAGNFAVTDVSTNRTLSGGLRQRTVTGANWSVTSTFLRSWDDATTDSVNRWYQPSLALQVIQPLLRDAWPMVNLAALRIARLDHELSLAEFRSQVEQTVVDVMTTYYELIQARENVRIAQRLFDATADTFETVKKRRKLDATVVPIKQTESAMRTREAVLLQAQKTARDLQDALVRLIGDSQLNLLEQDIVLVPTTEIPDVKVVVDTEDQLLTALRLNPQLEQLRLAIRQADINVRVAKWQTLPSLNITAGATVSGASRQDRHDADNSFWSGNYVSYNALLELEYPIGNRLQEAELAEARLTRMRVVSQLQNVTDQVAQRVRERVRQIHERYTELQLQRQAAAAAREELDALNALERLRAQLTPEFLNLKLNAQASVARAEEAVIQALTDYATARLDLQQATGAVLESQRVQLALPVITEPADLPAAATDDDR